VLRPDSFGSCGDWLVGLDVQDERVPQPDPLFQQGLRRLFNSSLPSSSHDDMVAHLPGGKLLSYLEPDALISPCHEDHG